MNLKDLNITLILLAIAFAILFTGCTSRKNDNITSFLISVSPEKRTCQINEINFDKKDRYTAIVRWYNNGKINGHTAPLPTKISGTIKIYDSKFVLLDKNIPISEAGFTYGFDYTLIDISERKKLGGYKAELCIDNSATSSTGDFGFGIFPYKART